MTWRIGFAAALALLILCLAACGKQESALQDQARRSRGAPADDGRGAQGEGGAPEAARQYSAQEMEDFLRKTEARLSELDEKAVHLKVEARSAGEEKRADLNHRLEEIRHRRGEAYGKLERLRGASGKAYGKAREEMESAMAELEKSYDAASHL